MFCSHVPLWRFDPRLVSDEGRLDSDVPYRTDLTVAQTTYAHETVGTCTCRHLTTQPHKCVRSTLSANLTASRAWFLRTFHRNTRAPTASAIHDSGRPRDRRWDLLHDIRCLFRSNCHALSIKLSLVQISVVVSTKCGEEVHHSSVAARRARLARGRKLFSALLLKVLIPWDHLARSTAAKVTRRMCLVAAWTPQRAGRCHGSPNPCSTCIASNRGNTFNYHSFAVTQTWSSLAWRTLEKEQIA